MKIQAIEAVVTFSWDKYEKVNGRGTFVPQKDVLHVLGVEDIVTLLDSAGQNETVDVRPLSNFALPWGEIYGRLNAANVPDLWLGARFEDLHVL